MSHPQSIPACPHCEYDLSGVVASWHSECPLTGVCSECGGLLDWTRVLTAGTDSLPWFIEHGPGRFFRRIFSTMFRSLLTPRSFWKTISAHTVVSPWRLLLWLPILLFMLHITKALLANAARAIVHIIDNNGFWYWLAWASDDWTQPFLLVYYNPSPQMRIQSHYWQFLAWPPPIWGLIAASITAPVMLLLISSLSDRNHMPVVRIARTGIYGLAWIPMLWFLALLDSTLRLLFCLAGMALRTHVSGQDVEMLYDPLWSAWSLWAFPAAAWWTWWWKCAIAAGLQPRDTGPVTASVLGISLCFGLLVTATMQLLWR